MTDSPNQLLHATAIAWAGQAALLCGPSGSGKSDLALRFLALGADAQLVADDQVALSAENGRVFATAPQRLSGLLEIRGLGLWRRPALRRAELRLIVNLVPRDAVPRLPESQFAALAGAELPVLALHAFDASAPIKLRVVLQTLSGLPPGRGFPDDDGEFG